MTDGQPWMCMKSRAIEAWQTAATLTTNGSTFQHKKIYTYTYSTMFSVAMSVCRTSSASRASHPQKTSLGEHFVKFNTIMKVRGSINLWWLKGLGLNGGKESEPLPADIQHAAGLCRRPAGHPRKRGWWDCFGISVLRKTQPHQLCEPCLLDLGTSDFDHFQELKLNVLEN